MKKIIGWLIGIACVVAISIFYHSSVNNKFEDTVVDDVDLEGIVEIETTGNNKDTNEEETNHNSGDEKNSVLDEEKSDETNSDTNNKQDSGDDEIKEINKTQNDDTKIETMAGAYSSYSNSKNAWGFVRKPEGTQPEFYGPYTKVLDNYEGIYAGNKDEKVIYLTFDEGYENGYTASILDSLKEKGVTAVFFVTMPYVKQNPDLIQRMIDENQIVRQSHCKSPFYA